MSARFAFAIFLVALCQMGAAQELEIDRETRTVPYFKRPEGPEGWIKLESGLYQAEFQLPQPFGGYRPNPPASADSKLKRKSAQEILEDAGIEFGKGASAHYDGATGKLRVTNTKEQLEQVLAYLETQLFDHHIERRMTIRTEIYELTKLQALQLLESAASYPDHTPERDAAIKAVRKGQAKLVSTASVTTTPSQRAQLDGACQAPILARKRLSGTAGPRVEQDERQYGTMLEVEPTYYEFEQTIDLNIALEYHTADPKPAANGLEFYPKKIVTAVAFHPEEYVIIGSWSGPDSNSAMVAFVTASTEVVER